MSCGAPFRIGWKRLDPALRKEVRFYVDDLFLHVHALPLRLELVQNDWFVGDVIRWNLSPLPGVENLDVSLLQNGRLVRRAEPPGSGAASSTISTIGLAPGICTLAASGRHDNSDITTSRNIYLAASPFK